MNVTTTTAPAFPATLPASAPPAFHLLSKPTGATCNLDCAYCFFLAKELLYPGRPARMADKCWRLTSASWSSPIARRR